MTRVRLAPGVAAELHASADAALPREGCGLLAGTRADGEVRVASAHAAANLAGSRSRFLVDPGDLVAADDAARAAGLELVGAWHSHPGGEPRPSRADLEGSWDGWITLIVGCGAGGARLAAWGADGGRFAKLTLADEGAAPRGDAGG